MDRKTLEKMSEIEEFLDHAVDREETGALHFDPDNVQAMYSYASALVDWEEDGFNSNSWLSTDSQLLLKYGERLAKQFGLPILNHEDGEKREKVLKELLPVFRTDVSKGFLN